MKRKLFVFMKASHCTLSGSMCGFSASVCGEMHSHA